MDQISKSSSMYAGDELPPFRILSLPVDKGACGYMRIRTPFKIINKLGLADAQIMERIPETEKEFREVVGAADVIIARPGVQKLMSQVLDMFPTKKIIVDFDDDLFNILPGSEHYRQYGTEDVTVELPNGEKVVLWKTGLGDFDKWANRQRLLEIQWMLEEATAVTAVTDRLAQWLSERGGREVVTITNNIDLNLYPDVEVSDNKKKPAEFRIGFCGGMSHNGDINYVKDALLKFLKKNKDVTFHMIGHNFPFFKEIEDRAVKHDWLPFEANPMRMKMLDLDVLIAPLQKTWFNIRKDPLKFWDAAGVQIPLVASNIPPFSDVIEDGKTGFLFDEPEGMIKIIKKLMKDRELGKTVAKNARSYVEGNRDIRNYVQNIVGFYQKVATQVESR